MTEVRGYLEDLMAAVRAAQDQGLADNSPEMIEAVRTELEPAYGSWAMFAEWLPLNIEGLLRIWAETGATGSDAGALIAGNLLRQAKRRGLGRQIERGFATFGVERD